MKNFLRHLNKNFIQKKWASLPKFIIIIINIIVMLFKNGFLFSLSLTLYEIKTNRFHFFLFQFHTNRYCRFVFIRFIWILMCVCVCIWWTHFTLSFFYKRWWSSSSYDRFNMNKIDQTSKVFFLFSCMHEKKSWIPLFVWYTIYMGEKNNDSPMIFVRVRLPFSFFFRSVKNISVNCFKNDSIALYDV